VKLNAKLIMPVVKVPAGLIKARDITKKKMSYDLMIRGN